MTKAKQTLTVLASIVGALVFIYFYPRILVELLSESNPWTSYLYHYGFGVLFFSFGMWILLKSGAAQRGRGHDSKWMRILVIGLGAYISVHTI